MAKLQCQLILQLLSRTLNSQKNSKVYVSAVQTNTFRTLNIQENSGVSVSAGQLNKIPYTEQPGKQRRLSVCPSNKLQDDTKEACWSLFGAGTAWKGYAPRSNRKLAGRCTGPWPPGKPWHPEVTGKIQGITPTQGSERGKTEKKIPQTVQNPVSFHISCAIIKNQRVT